MNVCKIVEFKKDPSKAASVNLIALLESHIISGLEILFSAKESKAAIMADNSGYREDSVIKQRNEELCRVPAP